MGSARLLSSGGKRRFSPWAILQAAAIEGANVRLFKAEWSEDLHPRDPATGQFIETGGAEPVGSANQDSVESTKTPDHGNAWPHAANAVDHGGVENLAAVKRTKSAPKAINRVKFKDGVEVPSEIKWAA
jgi:hypothetical protein